MVVVLLGAGPTWLHWPCTCMPLLALAAEQAFLRGGRMAAMAVYSSALSHASTRMEWHGVGAWARWLSQSGTLREEMHHPE